MGYLPIPNIKSLQKTAFLIHVQLPNTFPDSLPTALHFWHYLILNLCWREHSHDVAYRTAVGRKMHSYYYEDSIYVINTDLPMFVQSVLG